MENQKLESEKIKKTYYHEYVSTRPAAGGGRSHGLHPVFSWLGTGEAIKTPAKITHSSY
ncbi:MAG TPA: hypothetical protein VMT96_00635 [Candidatus Bathyarchaeia archaeon]|nr:hypothetical protein [Candidatus Bathyarchaeia archaeon]